MMPKAQLKRIPDSLYKRILSLVPIPCVDVIIVSHRRFLLCRRNQHPAKGKWWLVGGRIIKGETLVQAVKRKVYEETGISTIAATPQFLTIRETMFRKSKLGPPPHTINAVFLVVVSDKSHIRPDITSDELAWFSKVNSHWSPYVKDLLAQAGFAQDCRQSTGRGHPGVAEDPAVSVWTKGPARRRAPGREVLSGRREAVLRVRDRELDRDRQIVTGRLRC